MAERWFINNPRYELLMGCEWINGEKGEEGEYKKNFSRQAIHMAN
jgi:hypothetical protein